VCVKPYKECIRREQSKVQIVEKVQGVHRKILEKIFKSEVFIISKVERRVMKEHIESVREIRRKSTKCVRGELVASSKL
jgi:hypothetical protein